MRLAPVPNLLFGAALLLFAAPAFAQDKPFSGMAISGDVKYKPGFDHFDYVNPDAPKGGDIKEAAIGTFDSLNPFIVQGTPSDAASQTIDTLLTQSYDEPFSEYALIAKSVEVAPDKRWEIFHLDTRARFHDGSPITADDVLFSFTILKTKGLPFFRAYYNLVTSAEKLDDHTVRFNFSDKVSNELPLIMGQLPVLSAAYWKDRDFSASTLDAPLGNGPYKIESREAGRDIVLARVPDYWAKDLPSVKGLNNFDHIRIDYYRDDTVALEAFKAGAFDLRQEVNSKQWATGYDSPATKDGRIVKGDFPNKRPQGMQGFAFNIRPGRPFTNQKLRRAIIQAFDFEWANKNLFFGLYTRDTSYFTNSVFAANGLPNEAERKLLDPLRADIPPEVFTTTYTLPVSDASGEDRDNLRIAVQLLKDAGYQVKGGKLAGADGKPVAFELLLDNPAFERVALPFKQNLAKLGIEMSVRTVDAAQYKQRLDNRDYDMTIGAWGESESPGNEQREFWGSSAADQPGSMNIVGIKSKAVDALVEDIANAPDRDALITACRALDRVLLAGDYVVPNWSASSDHIAYWSKFGMPQAIPYQGVQTNAWWVDPAKAAALKQGK